MSVVSLGSRNPKSRPSVAFFLPMLSMALDNARKLFGLQQGCSMAEKQASDNDWSSSPENVECGIVLSELDNFFAFMQCQLRVELKDRVSEESELADPVASNLWSAFRDIFSAKHTNGDKWMPFHTVLGSHELFVAREIISAPVKIWTRRCRFALMFLFRAHCHRSVFMEVQKKMFASSEFWADPQVH